MRSWGEVSEVKCKEIRWRLAPYDSGELSQEEQQMVEAHLASCDRCRQKLARLSKVPALLQSVHDDTWWADVRSPVMERLRASADQTGPSRAKAIKAGKTRVAGRPIWQLALIGLVAVVIVVGAIVGVMYPREGNNVAQAADAARNNPQVEAILGEKDIEVIKVEIAHPNAYVHLSSRQATVEVQVDLESIKVKTILLQASHTFGPPVNRPELTEDEKAKAIEIAEAAPYTRAIIGYGFELGEPSSSHPVLGDDPRRVAWVPLVGDIDGYDYRGVVIDLDDQDVTVIWEGEVPSWWPY